MAKKEAEQALLEEIAASDAPINATLYEQYSRNLRKAVDGAFAEDNSGGLSDRLRANVSRFAVYKAYHATGEIRKEIGKNGDIDAGRKELHAFNRYQAAEYNTTVSRCRTAKQFQEFSQPDNVRLFPNIKWLPSRSATPRKQHILFYNRVWAKNDSFWNINQPGNLWNCKCDWEETDEPVTDGNPTTPIRHDGLEKNPAITGEVFTDEASYIKNCSNARKRKIEHWTGDKLLRKETVQHLKSFQGNTVTINKRGEEINVVFDSKTTSHFANDVAQSAQFLWNELMGRMPQILSKSKLVAHEPNTKLDKKPWAVEYYYYEYKTQHYTFYLGVEYNNIVDENRQFYRLYSITTKLRESVTMY